MKPGQLIYIAQANFLKKYLECFGGLGPKSRCLIYQPTSINHHPITMSLFKVCTQTIKDRKHHILRINRWHYIAKLSKSQKDVEIVSRLHSRAKNKLEMFVISCTNI